MINPRILIVEDEHIVSLDLQEKLMAFGYHDVIFASSGEQAVEKAGRLHPDLVLMDIILEGPMDGVKAATLIHQRIKVPVIFLTAHGDDITTSRALNLFPAHFVRFVIKPLQEESLRIAIDNALQA
jgi:CheY-like chemotaxis protein